MKHQMSIMNDEGDTTCTWDPSNAESVGAAQETFDSYRSRGHRPARMGADGSTGAFMDSFDPEAEDIVFVPPLQGG